MILIISITILVLFLWLFSLVMYFDINKSGKFYIVANDTFLRFTFAQILVFIMARFFLLRIKCKIIYDKGCYWIFIKHGFFRYQSINLFIDQYYFCNNYDSYGKAMEAIKKYFHREIAYGSIVKYKYTGDVIAEIRYRKGSR